MYTKSKKVISIVLSLMFVLLSISNTIVSSNATSKVFVTDAFNETFTRSDGNYTVNCRLPKLLLDGNDSIQANQNILNRFQNSIEESRSGYDMHEISYSYSINNGILSLVIKDHLVPSTAHYEFLVYNFNLSTNTSLDRYEFLQQNNYDWNKIVEVIKEIYKQNLPKWNQSGTTDQKYYNDSISDSYLNQTELYLDNGKLYAMCYWRSLAGSSPNGRYDAFEIKGDISTDIDNVDSYIIDQVNKYTSEGLTDNIQYNAIMNAQISGEVKLKLLNELFVNEGFTDMKEGISYLQDTSTYRSDYRFLTTDEIYCASNYYDWLYSDQGFWARSSLYSSGLIFNGELTAYFNPTTYTDRDYPGVKKNKKFLKDFLEQNEHTFEDLKGAKTSAKYFSILLKLNNIETNDSIDELMDRVISATNQSDLESYQKQFANHIISEAKANGNSTIYIEGERFSKALKYASGVIEFVNATANDIYELMYLDQEIAKYEYYKEFLTEVYNCSSISGDMRMAAYLLLDDINNGYYNRIVGILGNVLKMGQNFITVDYNIWKDLFGASGELFGDAIATIKLSVFISNIVVDTGDFVNQVSYTLGYGELSKVYCAKLKQDKSTFLASRTSENAWQFFSDYTMLWSLRYKGEEQYLRMNKVKMFIFGEVKTTDYTMKYDVARDNQRMLNQKRFELAANYTIPEGVMYSSKAVINCPVDVYVYSQSGELITKLMDGVESDIRNKYGRFAVMKQSYSGEYSKIIALYNNDSVVIQSIANSQGLVDYSMATNNNGIVQAYSINHMNCNKGTIIVTKSNGTDYSIDFDGNGKTDYIGDLHVHSDKKIAVYGISSSKSSLEIKIGNSSLIDVSVTPTNATIQDIDWYTDNEDIIKVQNGVVSAVGVGEANVFAKAIDSEGIGISIPIYTYTILGDTSGNGMIDIIDATFIQYTLVNMKTQLSNLVNKYGDVDGNNEIEIVDATYIQRYVAGMINNFGQPESVSLNYTSKQMNVGDTFTLKASITPSQVMYSDIAWASSNKNVATVNNGVVTAKAAGTATITASTYNGKTAKCNVTVASKPTSISLNTNDVTLHVDESVQLTASLKPSGISDTISWTSQYSNFASVSNNGYVYANHVGDTIITAKTSNGLTATCTVHVVPKSPSMVFIDKETLSIDKGEGYQLSASVSPPDADQTISWSSSDTSIATVDSTGYVTGIKSGRVNITARASNGISETCAVEVYQPISGYMALVLFTKNEPNGCARITKDFTVNLLSNDTDVTTFCGVINGDFHTITYSYEYKTKDTSGDCYRALIPKTDGALIKNITVSGDFDHDFYPTASNKSYCAGVVAYAKNTIFENCSNQAKIENAIMGSNSGYAYTGGITAWGDNCVFKDCKNSGNILTVSMPSKVSASVAGGIVGVINGGSIVRCISTGGIGTHATNSSSIYYTIAYSGGIVGQSYSATINSCSSSGNVNANSWPDQETQYKSVAATGGIVGAGTANILNSASTCILRPSGIRGSENYSNELIGYEFS